MHVLVWLCFFFSFKFSSRAKNVLCSHYYTSSMPVERRTVSLPLNGFGRAACSSGRFARKTKIGREMSWPTENNQSSTRWTRFEIWNSATQLQLVSLTWLLRVKKKTLKTSGFVFLPLSCQWPVRGAEPLSSFRPSSLFCTCTELTESFSFSMNRFVSQCSLTTV